MRTNLFNAQLAEIKVSYSHKIKPSELKALTSSRDAYENLLSIWDDQLEHIECFYLLLLSRSNRILGYYQLSKGGISGTVADPKCIFQVALKCNASALILAHNHPSGNLKPSEMDIRLTRKLVEVGKLLELPILDHLILTPEAYFSFADDGLM